MNKTVAKITAGFVCLMSVLLEITFIVFYKPPLPDVYEKTVISHLSGAFFFSIAVSSITLLLQKIVPESKIGKTFCAAHLMGLVLVALYSLVRFAATGRFPLYWVSAGAAAAYVLPVALLALLLKRNGDW